MCEKSCSLGRAFAFARCFLGIKLTYHIYPRYLNSQAWASQYNTDPDQTLQNKSTGSKMNFQILGTVW